MRQVGFRHRSRAGRESWAGPGSHSPPAQRNTGSCAVRDDRANGIVVPVDGSLGLSAVFGGASSKATTHLIFDLTGYFVPIP